MKKTAVNPGELYRYVSEHDGCRPIEMYEALGVTDEDEQVFRMALRDLILSGRIVLEWEDHARDVRPATMVSIYRTTQATLASPQPSASAAPSSSATTAGELKKKVDLRIARVEYVGGTFPIVVEVDGEATPLNFEEAQELIANLQVAIDEHEGAEAEREAVDEYFEYVQVRFMGRGSVKYTYLDPTHGELDEGDYVLVTVGSMDSERVAQVVNRGRGHYSGECKAVIARLNPERL